MPLVPRMPCGLGLKAKNLIFQRKTWTKFEALSICVKIKILTIWVTSAYFLYTNRTWAPGRRRLGRPLPAAGCCPWPDASWNPPSWPPRNPLGFALRVPFSRIPPEIITQFCSASDPYEITCIRHIAPNKSVTLLKVRNINYTPIPDPKVPWSVECSGRRGNGSAPLKRMWCRCKYWIRPSKSKFPPKKKKNWSNPFNQSIRRPKV